MPLRRDLPSHPEFPEIPTLWDSIEPPVVVPSIEPKPGSIEEAFEAFRAANPWVEEALRRLAMDLVHRGRTRIGMKMLFEVLRWQHQRLTNDPASEFKLNNSYTSRYARLLADKHDELAEVFEMRVLRSA